MPNLDRVRECLQATQEFLQNNSLEDFKSVGVRGKTDGNHIILDYDMIEVDWNQPYGYVCRGLVLSADDYSVLGMGLHKFFNAGESQAAAVDWNTARVFEKLDGTMVKRWYSPYTGEFEYTTRYQLPEDIKRNTISDIGMTWHELITRCVGDLPSTLNQRPDETLVFEVMSPLNRVVVHHGAYKASLLARRDNVTLQEHDLKDHPLAPKTFAFSSHTETEAFADTLRGVEQEGFVVVDDQFRRIKIKGGEYVRLHHLKDSAANSLKSLILVIRNGEQSEISTYFPEFIPSMEKIEAVIGAIVREHVDAYNELKDIEVQKDFALAVQARKLSNSGLLFSVRAGKAESIENAINQMNESAYVRFIKPHVEAAGITLTNVGE